MLSDEKVFGLTDGVSFQQLGEGEGAVVLIFESGQLYTCNDTTAAFLSAIDGKRTFGEVVNAVFDKFNVDIDRLRVDLSALAGKLVEEGIIR